jgi:hypothetical protein
MPALPGHLRAPPSCSLHNSGQQPLQRRCPRSAARRLFHHHEAEATRQFRSLLQEPLRMNPERGIHPRHLEHHSSKGLGNFAQRDLNIVTNASLSLARIIKSRDFI